MTLDDPKHGCYCKKHIYGDSLKIVVLSDQFPPLYPGGAQNVAERLSLGFKGAGHSVRVLTTREPGHKQPHEVLGLPIESIETPYGVENLRNGFDSISNSRWILEVIRRDPPDLIHAHNVHSALGWGWLKDIAHQIPVVLTLHDCMTLSQGKIVPPAAPGPTATYVHGFFEELRRFRSHTFIRRKMLLRSVLPHASAVVAVSQDLRRRLYENGYTGVQVINNGVDLDSDPAEPLSDIPGFLFLGRPTAEKGVPILIEALSAVGRPVRLELGCEVSSSAEAAIRSRTPSFIDLQMPGWLMGAAKSRSINRSWAVANLSICVDTFNLTNLEAMARYRPVLGTLWGGTPEVVRQGIDGWLVDPHRREDVIVAIRDIMDHPQEVLRRGRSGHQRATERFQWTFMVDQYLQLFEKILSMKKDKGKIRQLR